MRVLVACEESQAVTIAFRERGHEAFSCDLQPCSGGHPEWHYECSVFDIINDGWDMMIGFPPCTYLATVGMANKSRDPGRELKTKAAIEFVKQLWAAPINKVCLENPHGVLGTRWRRWDQKIQPYYFGDNEIKLTYLWLRGLPKLNALLEVALNESEYRPQPYKIFPNGRKQNWSGMVGDAVKKSDRSRAKSKTFPGIAKAMAEQWG